VTRHRMSSFALASVLSSSTPSLCTALVMSTHDAGHWSVDTDTNNDIDGDGLWQAKSRWSEKKKIGVHSHGRVASLPTPIVTSGSGPVSVKSETPSKLSMPSPPPGKHAWCVLFHLPFATQFPLTRQIYQHENKARPPGHQTNGLSLFVSTLSSIPSSRPPVPSS
jgi:hypothetical protein